MILEIFEHADLGKRDVNEVIGNDINEYVNGFIKESPNKKNAIYVTSYSIFLFIVFLLFLKIYKVSRDGFSLDNFETEVLDVGIVLSYAIISFIFYPLLMFLITKSIKENWQGPKRLIAGIPTIIPVAIFASLIFIDNDNLRNFLDQELPIFTSISTFIVGILLCVITLSISYFSHIFTKKK